MARARISGVDFGFGDVVEFGGDEAVDVAVGGEGFDEGFFAAVVGEDAELDLGVVGGDEEVLRGGDEGAADLAADIGFDGNVLEVGIGGGEAAGFGDGLVEVGVDAAGFFGGEVGEGVEVGVFELGEGAVFDDEGGDGMFVGEFFEDHDVGGGAGLGFFDDGEVEMFEEDFGELFGGVGVEVAAGFGLDAFLEVEEFGFEAEAEGFEEGGVDHDAVVFHVCEDLDEGHFDFIKKAFHIQCF